MRNHGFETIFSKRVHVSEREFAVLRYLIERQGTVVTRDQLLVDVWRSNVPPRTRTVDMHIASLRQKLEKNPKNPEWILSVHSQGYRVRNPHSGAVRMRLAVYAYSGVSRMMTSISPGDYKLFSWAAIDTNSVKR